MARFRSGIRLAVLFGLTALLAACGTPIGADQDSAPGREALIANLRSPTDVDSLQSFRVRGSTEFSDGFVPGSAGVIGIEMWIDVVVDPPALHVKIEPVGDPPVSELGFAEEMVVIDDRVWRRTHEPDGWREVEMGAFDLAGWYRDALLSLQEPLTTQTGPVDLQDALGAAEIVSTEEVNGMRTTHFRLTTPAMLDLLAAGYETLQNPALDDECDAIFQDADEGEGGEPSASDTEKFMRCIRAALGRDMPPPEEYIDVYEMELWIADDGFIVKQHSYVEQSTPAYALMLDIEPPAGPFTTSSSLELYDFNADFTIESPVD